MSDLIRSLKFNFVFDVNRLKKDLQLIIEKTWINHYNTNDYTGDWSSISLMSEGGKSDNIYALNTGNQEVIYTDILHSCNYFKEIIDQFLFQKTTVRLLRLSANAVIKPHQDYCLGYEDGFLRLHIPIITNSEVVFILDDKRIIMNEGECWYIDANFTHSVSNLGKEDRIHLVIDGIRNKWTDTLFFEYAHENQFVKPIPKISYDQKVEMIEQLKKMKTPTADQIISDLLKDL